MAQTEVTGLVKRQANLTPFKPGENRYTRKAERIAGKLEELRREFFPAGGESAVDAGRLRLAALHYFTAETAKDAVVAQRSARLAEFLLSKLTRASAPRLPATDDRAALALEHLLNRKS
jgi:hypothetical protein